MAKQNALQKFLELQENQPAFLAEMRASIRQGREDLLATLMGPLAGVTREPGAPGTPTPQQVTEGLEQRQVNLPQDRIAPQQTLDMDMTR